MGIGAVGPALTPPPCFFSLVVKSFSRASREHLGPDGVRALLAGDEALHGAPGIEDREHAMHDIDGSGAWFRKARDVWRKSRWVSHR